MICVITQILLNQPKYTYPFQAKLLNLMLFYNGHDHTIIIVKDSSWLDVEIRNTQLTFLCMPICAGRRARIETETMAVPACCVPRSVYKRSIMPTRQSGSP